MTTTDQTRPTRWNAGALQAILDNPANRPVLFTNAHVVTHDPKIGTMASADVLLGGDLVVGVGPGIITAAGDDAAIVVDCTGTTISPSMIDVTAGLTGHDLPPNPSWTLSPGNPADFLITVDQDADNDPSPSRWTPSNANVLGLIRSGQVVVWDGRVVSDPRGGGAATDTAVAGSVSTTPDRLGVWVDETGFLRQELSDDGRYDETRGGRPHAFQGQYWVSGDRIDYLDDLGFWAFGDFRGEELHHAGYVMRRAAEREPAPSALQSGEAR